MVQHTDRAVSHVVGMAGDVGNLSMLPNFQLVVILSLANKIFPLALNNV